MTLIRFALSVAGSCESLGPSLTIPRILQVASASGYFELELVELQNAPGRLANGRCCASSDTLNDETTQCERECATFFRLCLKEYQSSVTFDGRCSYGNQSSPVLAGNSFTFVEPLKSNARLAVNFTFRWTVRPRTAIISS